MYCAKREGEDWQYLLWGSFFSRIPSTPSDFILKKKPPFLQYNLLGSLKLPGGKPPLPPSSGVEGRVVISPVAISSSYLASWQLLRLLLEKCRSPTVASHLPLAVPSSFKDLRTNWFYLTSEGSLLEQPPSQGSKCPLSPENLKDRDSNRLRPSSKCQNLPFLAVCRTGNCFVCEPWAHWWGGGACRSLLPSTTSCSVWNRAAGLDLCGRHSPLGLSSHAP